MYGMYGTYGTYGTYGILSNYPKRGGRLKSRRRRKHQFENSFCFGIFYIEILVRLIMPFRQSSKSRKSGKNGISEKSRLETLQQRNP